MIEGIDWALSQTEEQRTLVDPEIFIRYYAEVLRLKAKIKELEWYKEMYEEFVKENKELKDKVVDLQRKDS